MMGGHVLNVKDRVKPIDVFIIGAQKAGTTSLKGYLADHPMICAHDQLEMPFFVNDHLYSLGYPSAFKRYFPHFEPGQTILAKNVDVYTNISALQLLHKHNPEVRIILLLRNPVDRAYSAYWYARQKGWEPISSFDQAVWLDPARFPDPILQRHCAYLDRGSYARWLKKTYQFFPNENVWVYLFEVLKAEPGSICNDVLHKLGLSPVPLENYRSAPVQNRAALPRSATLAKLVFQPGQIKPLREILRRFLPDDARDRIKGWISQMNKKTFAYPPMNPETRQKWVEYYRPLNQELSELLGVEFSHWDQ